MQIDAHSRSIILASQSPRRKYLLQQVGLTFSVIPSLIPENPILHSSPEQYVKNLSEQKAADISKKHPESWVIGADTVVLSDGHVLGKPRNRSDAWNMLKQLSGNTHTVLTGYTICCKANQKQFSETVKTEVTFKNLSDSEIKWYINTEEPFDKAGAYGIQEVGMFLVKQINGSYTNVVGLPVCEVMTFLIKEGVLPDLLPPTHA